MGARDPERRMREQRQRHIKESLERLEGLAGGPFPMDFSEDCPDEIKEKFLESVLAFEEVKPVAPFDELVKRGLHLPAPEEMSESQLSVKLDELVRDMALLGIYLSSTDHLSDRELYRLLWADLLREPATLMPHNPEFALHLDVIGGCSEQDIQIYLKHYADDETRENWARRFPKDSIPPHEPPPYERDRHLPQRPLPPSN